MVQILGYLLGPMIIVLMFVLGAYAYNGNKWDIDE